jgi:hypothetical protein
MHSSTLPSVDAGKNEALIGPRRTSRRSGPLYEASKENLRFAVEAGESDTGTRSNVSTL